MKELVNNLASIRRRELSVPRVLLLLTTKTKFTRCTGILITVLRG